MKTNQLKLLAAFHFSLFLLPSFSAVPLRWTVETSRLQPVAFDAVRGETMELEASFKSYGKPVATSNQKAFLCWQTNGMGSAWWTTNAVTTATVARVLFTPQMDPGAPVVHGFIGLSDTTNQLPATNYQLPSLSYRAAFTLRFRHGPGETPNALPLPTPTIDCQKVTFLHPESAPFSGGGGGGGGVTTQQATNIAQKVIREDVRTNYLCTVAAAQAKADAAVDGFYTAEYQPHMQQIATSLNSKLTKPGSITSGHLVEFSGTSGSTADSGYSVDDFYLTSQPIYSTKKIWVKSTDVSNPSYVTVGRIRASGDTSYPYSRMGTAYFKTWDGLLNYTSYRNGSIAMNWSDEQEEDAIFYIPTNRIAGGTLALREDIPAAPDFSTNNTALVYVVTNLAPAKARGISLSDPVRHCNWYQVVTNGVFFWLVEE